MSRWSQARLMGEVGAFAEAAMALTLASLAVRLLPFRWLVRTMGRRDPVRRGAFRDTGSVRRAVHRASRRLPWRTVCIQQGLAAHWMLRRRGMPAKLHYGIRNGVERLSAHVWVTVEGAAVVGEEHEDPHAPVVCFPVPR
jgi:hypothetical protein